MAIWDSADLLARVQRLINRPTTDAALGSAEIYAFLTESQTRWIPELAVVCADAMAIEELMITTDAGFTYTMLYEPLGDAEFRNGRSGRSLVPGEDWDTAADLVVEGKTIRFPGGVQKTFASGLYVRYVPQGSTIDGATQPTLKPDFARILMVYDACIRCAMRMRDDPTPYRAVLQSEWSGDPAVGSNGLQATLRARYYGRGIPPGENMQQYWKPTP